MHDHNHTHDHHHEHEHGQLLGHVHAPASYGRAFAIGVTINVIFIIAEVIYGIRANSMALLADAGHNASDVLGLFMAWGAILLSKRKPGGRYTYGFKSSSILASLANTVLLLVAIGAIILESFQRLMNTPEIAGYTVMIVAGIGILINGFTAYLLMQGGKDDLNIKAAFQHFVADAAISFGVVVSAFIILQTGFNWVDPLVSLAVSIFIVFTTWSILKESLSLSMQAVPGNIDKNKVSEFLAKQPGVAKIHDLHIWAMSTTETALTVHLIMPAGHPGDEFMDKLTHDLDHEFNIGHITVQIEMGTGNHECKLAPDNIV